MTRFEKMLRELILEYSEESNIYDIDEFESFNQVQTADIRRYKDAYNDYKEGEEE